MTKDGALGLSADLGQPDDILALMGPSRARAPMVSLLYCLKTSPFFVTQAHWLSFGSLLVNLSVLWSIAARASKALLVCDSDHFRRQQRNLLDTPGKGPLVRS
jgi:hypothetical protein